MLNFRGMNKKKKRLFFGVALVPFFLTGSVLWIYSSFVNNDAESSARYYNKLLHTDNKLDKQRYIPQSSSEGASRGVRHETDLFSVDKTTQDVLSSTQPFSDCDIPRENIDCAEAKWRQISETYFSATLTKYKDNAKVNRDVIFVIYLDKKEGRLVIERTQY